MTATRTDAHAIYLLNLFLAFLQPRFDPSLQEDLLADEIEEGGESTSPLPSSRDDEFRPFVRRLPEWQFWCARPPCILCLVALLGRVPLTLGGCGGGQAVGDARDGGVDLRELLRDVRRARVLADPRRLLLRPLPPHHAPPNTVRSPLYSLCPLPFYSLRCCALPGYIC